MIREEIAELLYKECVVWTGKPEWYSDWHNASEEIKESWCEQADQILSIPLLKALLEKAEQTRGKCPRCNGEGGWMPKYYDMVPDFERCEVCQGTGKGDYQLDRLVVLDEEQKLPSLTGEILPEPFEILRQKGREAFAAGCHAYKEAMLNEGWRKVKEVNSERG